MSYSPTWISAYSQIQHPFREDPSVFFPLLSGQLGRQVIDRVEENARTQRWIGRRGFSPNNVFNTWGSYGLGKEAGVKTPFNSVKLT